MTSSRWRIHKTVSLLIGIVNVRQSHLGYCAVGGGFGPLPARDIDVEQPLRITIFVFLTRAFCAREADLAQPRH